VKGVRVEVLESKVNPYESCNSMWEDLSELRMSWGLTKIGKTAMSSCPVGFVGYAQKRCVRSEKDDVGKWVYTDFSRCIHSTLVQLNLTVSSASHSIK
jgi:hypothetical protein